MKFRNDAHWLFMFAPVFCVVANYWPYFIRSWSVSLCVWKQLHRVFRQQQQTWNGCHDLWQWYVCCCMIVFVYFMRDNMHVHICLGVFVKCMHMHCDMLNVQKAAHGQNIYLDHIRVLLKIRWDILPDSVFDHIYSQFLVCIAGDVYEGLWENDVSCGQGKMTFAASKDVLSGYFLNGLLNGPGVYTYANGELWV